MSDANTKSSFPPWADSPIWSELERQSTPEDAAQLLVRLCMPDIELILAKGGSSPKDFTLHDAAHGFRVTTWMVQIIPSDVLKALSIYELALLLLSAYLHDIGMTPEWGKVSAHKDYLISGCTDGFRSGELESFER